MSRSGRRIDVSILGHTYPVRARGGAREEQRIRRAAQSLEERIAGISEATGEVDARHLAVMAALALAAEVLEGEEARDRERSDAAAFRQVLKARSEKLLEMVEEELRVRLEAAS